MRGLWTEYTEAKNDMLPGRRFTTLPGGEVFRIAIEITRSQSFATANYHKSCHRLPHLCFETHR
jgi:hypothetical protein